MLKIQRTDARQAGEDRTCPGERYAISAVICRTRQRNQYAKCLLCRYRKAELAGATTTDPKVKSAVFRSAAVLGRVPQEINEYVVRKVGQASAQLLRAETPSGSRLVVASDLRENSRGFARIFCEGANRSGMNTVSIGTVPPELLAFVLGTDGCTGAAFVGGGNSPHSVNGVRLWRSDTLPMGFGTGLEKVGQIARRLRMGHSRLPGGMTTADPLPDYVAYVRTFAPKLSPLKLVVDAGHGTAGRLLKPVLEQAPVELCPLHFGEDPRSPFLGKRFPCEEVVAAVQEQVRSAGAELGAAMDFTGERVVFFDERGNVLRHDAAAGLIAAELLARSPGASVTYDLRSSAALRARIGACDGVPLASPTGLLPFVQHFRRNDAIYGADLTGLHYFKDLFRFPSPAVALLLMLSHLSRERKPVSELTADLNRFRQSGEVVIGLPSAEDAKEMLEKVKDEFPNADRDLIDGVTIRQTDWWFNLRQPGEKAELRLNVEGRTDRAQRHGRQTVERLISRFVSGLRA